MLIAGILLAILILWGWIEVKNSPVLKETEEIEQEFEPCANCDHHHTCRDFGCYLKDKC